MIRKLGVLAVVMTASFAFGCGGEGDGGGGGRADGGGGGGGNEDVLDDWPAASADFEDEVLDLVNARRAQGATCGGQTFGPTHALETNDKLTAAARLHAYDMYDRNFFGHTNPDDESPGDRIDAQGYAWSTWGENVANGQSSPEAVMQTWMSSSGHCANIMSPSFDEIGIGFYQGRWTQVFGAP